MTATALVECFRPAASDVSALRRLLAYVVALLAYPIRRYRQIALEYRLSTAARAGVLTLNGNTLKIRCNEHAPVQAVVSLE